MRRGWLATKYVNSPPVWTAPESGGRQPLIHHVARDPLLLAPQTYGLVSSSSTLSRKEQWRAART